MIPGEFEAPGASGGRDDLHELYDHIAAQSDLDAVMGLDGRRLLMKLVDADPGRRELVDSALRALEAFERTIARGEVGDVVEAARRGLLALIVQLMPDP